MTLSVSISPNPSMRQRTDFSGAAQETHKRGVKIVALLDESNQTAQYTGATLLQNSGITVAIDAKHAIAHNKIMIMDSGAATSTVITGSFNFSKAAEETQRREFANYQRGAVISEIIRCELRRAFGAQRAL